MKSNHLLYYFFVVRQRKFKLVIFLLFVLFPSQIFSQPIWTSVPTPSYAQFSSIATYNNNIYACPHSGFFADRKLFYSSNLGSSWNIISTYDFFGVSIVVKDLSNIFVIGNTSGGTYAVYKTTDNGLTWNNIFSPSGYFGGIPQIIQDRNGNIYTMNSFSYRSTDNGQNWSDFSLYVPDSPILSLYFDLSNNIYVGSINKILKSTNDGVDWQTITCYPNIYSVFYITEICVNADGYLFAGSSQGGGLYVSSNGGTNWTKSATSLDGNNIYSLYCSPDNSVYTSDERGTYRSANNGNSWTRVGWEGCIIDISETNVNDLVCLQKYDDFYPFPDADGKILVNWVEVSNGLKKSLLKLKVKGNNTLFCSINEPEGNNKYKYSLSNWLFSELSGSITNIPASDFLIDNAGNLYVAAPNNIFKTTDEGTNWQSYDISITGSISMSISPNNRIWASGSEDLYKSDDNGVSYQMSTSMITNAFKVFAKNNNDIFVGGTGRIYYSNNGGDSWNESSTGLPNVPVIDILSSNSGKLYAATNSGLYNSTDNGLSWEQNPLGSLTINSLSVSSENKIYLATNTGVYISDDDGINWVQNNDGLPTLNTTAITVTDDGKVIVGTLNFGIFKSVESALPVELNSLSASITKNSTVKISWKTETETNNFGFDIERKSIGQVVWKKIGFVEGNGNSNSPKEYSFIDEEILANCTYFYRLKQIDNDGTVNYSKEVMVEFNNLPQKFDLSQNYPNPFNPSTVINYQLPANTYVTLKVFDVIGNEVATLVNQEKPAGYHSVTFEAGKLSSGIYIYQLTAGEMTFTKKLILTK